MVSYLKCALQFIGFIALSLPTFGAKLDAISILSKGTDSTLEDKIAIVQNSLTDAALLGQRAVDALNNPQVVFSPAWQTYFGQQNGQNVIALRKSLLSAFTDVTATLGIRLARSTSNRFLGANTLTFAYTSAAIAELDACPPSFDGSQSVTASALNHGRDVKGNWVFLCPPFFSRLMSTLPGTMVARKRGNLAPNRGFSLLHELFHITSIVGEDRLCEDHAYDDADCRRLPDSKKILNAQNMALFALDVTANPDRASPAACPNPRRRDLGAFANNSSIPVTSMFHPSSTFSSHRTSSTTYLTSGSPGGPIPAPVPVPPPAPPVVPPVVPPQVNPNPGPSAPSNDIPTSKGKPTTTSDSSTSRPTCSQEPENPLQGEAPRDADKLSLPAIQKIMAGIDGLDREGGPSSTIGTMISTSVSSTSSLVGVATPTSSLPPNVPTVLPNPCYNFEVAAYGYCCPEPNETCGDSIGLCYLPFTGEGVGGGGKDMVPSGARCPPPPGAKSERP
ncbi:hypothetical protein LZ30DRAFT_691303 [Colletotrichum cereale]|nr:hypothetical protein LZ30DRAFT_691303 [Colletotrichum cereale]